jgi:hypothetical protein
MRRLPRAETRGIKSASAGYDGAGALSGHSGVTYVAWRFRWQRPRVRPAWASRTDHAARDSAAVLADTGAAGQTGHVRAADQAVETGVDRAAGAGETKIGRLVAGAARPAVAGTAA